MVSLLTRFVTGYAANVPVIDPRLIPHVDVPVVASQEDGPAAQAEVQQANETSEAQSDQ